MDPHTRMDENGLYRLVGETQNIVAIFRGSETLIGTFAVGGTIFALGLNFIRIVNPLWIPLAFMIYRMGRILYHMNRYDFPLADEYFTGTVNGFILETLHLIAVLTLEYLRTIVPSFLGRMLILPFCSWITCIFVFVLAGNPLGKFNYCRSLLSTLFHDWYIGYASNPKLGIKIFLCFHLVHLVLTSLVTFSLVAVTMALRNFSEALKYICLTILSRVSKPFPFNLPGGLPDPQASDQIYTRDRIYAPLADEHEIRLLKLEKWRPFQPLRAKLFHSTFDEAPPYEAISYCWGNQGKSHKILVNGHIMLVPKATYDALHGRSSWKKTRYLWIDYVCIDQFDDDEKSKQVQLMKDIYERAERVVIWLGESALVGFLAVSVLQEILVQVKNYKLSGPQIVSNCQWERLGIRWRCLQRFLCQPWFKRSWVMQEVAAAKLIDVVCGGLYIDFELLREVASLMTLEPSLGSMVRSGPQGIRAHHALGNLEAMGRMGKALNNMPGYRIIKMAAVWYPPGPLELAALNKLNDVESLRFESLLIQSHSFLATDPRDKIFSLYGLTLNYPSNTNGLDDSALYRALCEPPVTIDLAPDYTKTTLELYTDVGRHFMRNETAFLVLSKAGVGFERSIEGLPSWAPDWTMPMANVPLNLPTSPIDRQYKACGASLPQIHFHEDKDTNICFIESVRISSIKATGAMCPLLLDDDDEEDIFSSNGKYTYARRTLEMLEWHEEALALALEHATPSVGHSSPEPVTAEAMLSPQSTGKALLMRKFWKTICGEKSPTSGPLPDAFAQDYLDWVSLMEFVREDHKSTIGSHQRTSRLQRDGAPEEEPPLVVPSTDFFKRQHALAGWGSSVSQMAVGRQFFVTEDGCMGMGPPGMKAGDRIFVFCGSGVPVVLRKLKGEQREVYNGIMHYHEPTAETSQSEEQSLALDSEAVATSAQVLGDLWQLVGECYLNGFMGGEAFEGDDLTLESVGLV